MEKLSYQQLLENPLFISRYIEPNINWRHSYLNGKRGIKRLFTYPYAGLMRKFFLRSYFQKRVLRGIVDIPYVEIVLTTKCTLRCEHCCNLMQYFTPKAQYVGTLENIIESLEQLCSKVSSINRLRLIGGEPFLFKDLPQLLDYIESQKKILTYDILSNGSIDIKEPILQRMQKSKKIRKVSISDYSHVPNVRLKQESIFKNLKKYHIPFSLLKGGTWHKLERIHKRGRSKEQIIANYLSCRASCVSLIGGGGGKIAPKGAMFVCAAASSLSVLKGLEEFEGDYIDLMDKTDRFLEFYAQDFYKSCDYCQDYSKPSEKILAAIQTREVLRID